MTELAQITISETWLIVIFSTIAAPVLFFLVRWAAKVEKRVIRLETKIFGNTESYHKMKKKILFLLFGLAVLALTSCQGLKFSVEPSGSTTNSLVLTNLYWRVP